MTTTGSCLCGAVSFTIDGALRQVIACHCTQCRKQSGHFVAATAADKTAVTITGGDAITWYIATPGYRRGFCGTCGSLLFWEDEAADTISIMAGVLDGSTGVKISHHIHVAAKGDYYRIADGVPQHPGDTDTPG